MNDINDMRLCPFCGAPLPENSRFCPRCGASVAELTPPAAPEPPAFAAGETDAPANEAPTPAEPAPESPAPRAPEDSRAFQALRMHLHQESKAWRFFAIGVLVIMMAFVGMFVWLGGLGLLSSGMDAEDAVGGFFVISVLALWSGIMTLSLLPVVIVGFVMGSKVLRYWEQAATDCTNALKHASSVGVIVLAVFFSTPALIIIIINFVKTKRNRAELEAVLARQQAEGRRASW